MSFLRPHIHGLIYTGLVMLVGLAAMNNQNNLLFWVFGYTHISRPLKRVRRQRSAFRARHPPRKQEAARGEDEDTPTWSDLGEIACKLAAFPVSAGNAQRAMCSSSGVSDDTLASE